MSEKFFLSCASLGKLHGTVCVYVCVLDKFFDSVIQPLMNVSLSPTTSTYNACGCYGQYNKHPRARALKKSRHADKAVCGAVRNTK